MIIWVASAEQKNFEGAILECCALQILYRFSVTEGAGGDGVGPW